MTDYTYATVTSQVTDDVLGGIKRVYARIPVGCRTNDTLNTDHWFTSWCIMIAAGATGGVSKFTAPGATVIPITQSSDGLVDVIMFGK
jgi:hypothetical protein